MSAGVQPPEIHVLSRPEALRKSSRCRRPVAGSLLECVSGFRSIRGDSSFHTWLRRITVNSFLNHKRKKELLATDITEAEGFPIARSDRTAFNNLMVQQVLQYLEEFPARQRLMFVMKHQEGLTYEEVADYCGTSVGTVEQTVFRVVEKLARSFTRRGSKLVREVMHDCQKFREDWVPGTAEGPVDCEECRRYCEEAGAILMAAACATPPIPEFTEEYWNGFDHELREMLIRGNASRSSHVYWKWSALAAAAAIALVVAWGRFAHPSPASLRSKLSKITFKAWIPWLWHSSNDPSCFFATSRKSNHPTWKTLMTPGIAQNRALWKLARRKLAGNFAPVRITLDEYEMSFVRLRIWTPARSSPICRHASSPAGSSQI